VIRKKPIIRAEVTGDVAMVRDGVKKPREGGGQRSKGAAWSAGKIGGKGQRTRLQEDVLRGKPGGIGVRGG